MGLADARATRIRQPRWQTIRTQLERPRDLYMMGDLTKTQYVMRRRKHPKATPKSGVTNTGATGVEAAFVASGIEIRL
jgi:hypothetical protein